MRNGIGLDESKYEMYGGDEAWERKKAFHTGIFETPILVVYDGKSPFAAAKNLYEYIDSLGYETRLLSADDYTKGHSGSVIVVGHHALAKEWFELTSLRYNRYGMGCGRAGSICVLTASRSALENEESGLDRFAEYYNHEILSFNDMAVKYNVPLLFGNRKKTRESQYDLLWLEFAMYGLPRLLNPGDSSNNSLGKDNNEETGHESAASARVVKKSLIPGFIKRQPLNEQQVLKKLKIKNFSQLTKDKSVKMMSLIRRMEPAVAKKAIEQYPDFAQTMTGFLGDYRKFLDKALENNEKSVRSYYESADVIIKELGRLLQSETLTFEQRMYVIERMIELQKMKGDMDRRNKLFITGMVLLVLGGLFLVARSANGTTNLFTDNADDDIPVVDMNDHDYDIDMNDLTDVPVVDMNDDFLDDTHVDYDLFN